MKKVHSLIIFAREPREGKVKTRLAKDLSKPVVLSLYKNFIKDVLIVAKKVSSQRRYIFYVGLSRSIPFLRSYQKSFILKRQFGKDLGERMLRAFLCAAREGAHSTIIIGTDCLTITAKDIEAAFAKLKTHDCVLGPSIDGGYYLIGLNKPCPSLFNDIVWSTEKVLDQTLKRAKSNNMKVALLSKKEDIDTISSFRKYAKKVVNSSEDSYTRRLIKTRLLSEI